MPDVTIEQERNARHRREQHWHERGVIDYIHSMVGSFVRLEMDVDMFRQNFAGAYTYVRSSAAGDQEAHALVSKLMVPVSEFSSGQRTEESLRLELANAIRPFEREHAEAEAITLPEPTTPELQYLAAITERLGVIIEQQNVLITAFSAGVEPEPEADGRKTIKLMDGSVAQIG